jgi:hypothetical protein
MNRDQRRERWRAALEDFAAGMLEPWQLDVAAEIFVSPLPKGSPTGRGDIWSTSQAAAARVGERYQADGRLNEWGNWPGPAKEEA